MREGGCSDMCRCQNTGDSKNRTRTTCFTLACVKQKGEPFPCFHRLITLPLSLSSSPFHYPFAIPRAIIPPPFHHVTYHPTITFLWPFHHFFTTNPQTPYLQFATPFKTYYFNTTHDCQAATSISHVFLCHMNNCTFSTLTRSLNSIHAPH